MALSATGLQQADALGAYFADLPLAAVYTSPRRRALQTAQALGRLHGFAPVVATGFDEIDFGDWSGESFAKLSGDAVWQSWNAARGSTRPPGGETMGETVGRAGGALTRLARRHEGMSVAIVTHCDVIRALVAHYLGMGQDDLLRFDIDPASVTRLTAGEDMVRINSVNERPDR